ncbi:type II toxin-antitoxin system death-on-curing family toxin [Bacillus sp. FSL K6-3431]|uniref:type II toxin-antitoxin system death-on-curing family toxin n=1 Tax=Bacillus sp. FSL K6-3431 TaxID=2921500 RepID=UPI0030F55E76
MSAQYLTGKQILAIHYTTMNRHNDLEQAGIKYQDRFESMLERPKSDYFGVELYPTVLEKGCCYYHSIAKDHIFHNGNKRTALVTFITYLRLNGMSLTFDNDEVENFTVYLAEDDKFKTNDCINHLVKELKPYIIQ